MKIRSLFLQVLTAGLLMAQNMSAQNKAQIEWYGFVAAQSYFDTRTSSSGAGGFLYLYPLDENITNLDTGDDLNARPQTSYYGAMARIGLNLKGPEVWGATSRGKIEIEFSGFSQTANPILYRHAFMALDWEAASMTLGQTWHPMNEMFPQTVSIAIGSPFNALNRSPQFRYDKYLGAEKHFRMSAAAIFQYLNASTGPQGRTNTYQKDACIPEFYLGADFSSGGFMFGVGGEWQRLVPRTSSLSGRKVIENIDGFAGMVQTKYEQGAFSWKAKALLGQNMSNLGICSGFGTALMENGDTEWQPLTALSTWTHISYGNQFKAGLFGGYMKNLGGKKGASFQQIFAIGGENLDAMYRVAPNITYNIGNLNLGCEYELTSVAYGTLQPRGNVADSHWITNHRVLLSVMYNF